MRGSLLRKGACLGVFWLATACGSDDESAGGSGGTTSGSGGVGAGGSGASSGGFAGSTGGFAGSTGGSSSGSGGAGGGAGVGGSAGAPELPLQDSVTQFGITWRFEAPVPVGQFVNGDYYV